MNILDRLTTASVGFLVATITIIAVSPMDASQPTVDRTGGELCQEVKYELDQSIERGTMTQQRADQIVRRCFKLYGGTN